VKLMAAEDRSENPPTIEEKWGWNSGQVVVLDPAKDGILDSRAGVSGAMALAARAAVAIFDMVTFGFNPGQKRGPDGRFIKMGGRGSAGKGGLPKGARPSEGGGAGAGGSGEAKPEPPAAGVRDGLSAALAEEVARGARRPDPVDEPAFEPPIGPDGKYIKPVKQIATWNGQVATRTSRTPYRYAAVVKRPDQDQAAIVSWHRTRAAASKGVLTGMQRQNGMRVVDVVEVRPEAPGESAMDTWERRRLAELEATAVERHGADESQWPAALRKNIAGLRKRRDAATMSSDAEVFAMPDDLADYWVRGEGAAKIRWCTEGAFERARRALREHVPAPMLDGTVANLYKRACGKWPGQDRD
jgi:hypothetical protein